MDEKISLSGTWQWHAADSDAVYPGTVPGSVLSDMLALHLCEDPYWRTNEYKVKQLFYKDYTYSRSFTLTNAQCAAAKATLVFDGLDTLATVSLNGAVILNADDMHRTWCVDVTGKLQAENTLQVDFASPLRYIEAKDAESDIFYASTGCQHGNTYLRKAHYMFGWDWGPNLPDAGIWRGVRLHLVNTAELSDVRLRQFHEDGKVRITAEIVADVVNPAAELQAVCTLTAPDGGETRVTVPVKNGKADAEFTVEHPELWWPNGYGAQPLYTVTVTLQSADKAVDSYTCRLGLRTITVCTDKDEFPGSQFAVVVNGQKIFSMGANYIPEDNIRGRVTAERSRRLIADCAAANFNMIRIWGGGYYPDDAVYDACDEYGILVWQDLMFGCNVYDLEDHFEQNILAETTDNVRRLRHHACMALWCGNNEMEWGWASWARLEGHRAKYKADYIKMFELLLPRCVHAADDQTYYWLSSPSSGGSFDDPNDWERGDKHYWDVWHSGKPFTEYRNYKFRFCSEYGFQSFPTQKTLDTFSLPEDQNIFSEVMESHQKNGMANTKIFTYVSDYYLYPKNMQCIAYISQILQLKAIQYGVEHWRRNYGRCMGSLYWQLNDCWPVASWASIDCDGRWKALHYGAKRFYSRFMATACEKEELSPEIDYYIHNEGFAPRKAELTVRLFRSDFTTVWEKTVPVEIDPFKVENVLHCDFSEFLADDEARHGTAAAYELRENGEIISRGTTLFVKPKHFHFAKPSYTAAVTEDAEKYTLHITADTFASYVELTFADADCVLSDNYFDITTPAGVTVTIDKSQLPSHPTAKELEKQLHILSVADTY